MLDKRHTTRAVEQSANFETLFLQRLKSLTPKFLDIRQKMGIGGNIGFAMLPDAHSVFSLGRLVEAQQTGKTTIYNNQTDVLSGGGRVIANPEYVIIKSDYWLSAAHSSDRFEGNIDVIAALMGYKKQVLAKLRYMISCLSTYQGANDTTRGGFKTAGRAIEESEERIAKVNKYVP